MTAVEPLTAREREVLLFEAQWFAREGSKLDVVRDKWGLGWVAYYQLVARLIQKPAALAYDPIVVNRLLAKQNRRIRVDRHLADEVAS